ncbi:transglutaminase family protein [Marinilabilia sp.]|uniref:transglutaminase-like domain-containing protein n=1 Tax=Marinilabilia sp. TaxID=2021252 RepID=UPI0025C593C1|nr:transglutaminase-like domain-containing protein [Marinilabilia sp.]
MIFLFVMIVSCNNNKTNLKLQSQLEELYMAHNFLMVENILTGIEKPLSSDLKYMADSLMDYIDRYRTEYPLTESDLLKILKERGIDASPTLVEQWEKKKQLDYLVMDGEKRYFKNAAYNLVLLNDSLASVAGSTSLNDDHLGAFCVSHISDVINMSSIERMGEVVCPENFLLNFSLRIHPGKVTPGSPVSVWMPFGVKDFSRQSEVRLLRSSVPDFSLSSEKCAHQSVFMTRDADEDGAAEFSVSSLVTSKAQYFSPERLLQSRFVELPDSVIPFAKERGPHLVFSNRIKELADSLTDEGMRPFEMVRRFYYWIDENIPWARAVEYGLIPNISKYTLENMHGDCGMQTMLFMSMCRYKGIPARWQSGWMLHPGNVNLHDWCEVWYEGVGWVPVDVSFKLQKSKDKRIREFYISGIDAYRFIVNKDFGREFCPPKSWPRSEPWDFQRGEAEWEKGNLYFDDWSYDMEVTYAGRL